MPPRVAAQRRAASTREALRHDPQRDHLVNPATIMSALEVNRSAIANQSRQFVIDSTLTNMRVFVKLCAFDDGITRTVDGREVPPLHDKAAFKSMLMAVFGASNIYETHDDGGGVAFYYAPPDCNDTHFVDKCRIFVMDAFRVLVALGFVLFRIVSEKRGRRMYRYPEVLRDGSWRVWVRVEEGQPLRYFARLYSHRIDSFDGYHIDFYSEGIYHYELSAPAVGVDFYEPTGLAVPLIRNGSLANGVLDFVFQGAQNQADPPLFTTSATAAAASTQLAQQTRGHVEWEGLEEEDSEQAEIAEAEVRRQTRLAGAQQRIHTHMQRLNEEAAIAGRLGPYYRSRVPDYAPMFTATRTRKPQELIVGHRFDHPPPAAPPETSLAEWATTEFAEAVAGANGALLSHFKSNTRFAGSKETAVRFLRSSLERMMVLLNTLLPYALGIARPFDEDEEDETEGYIYERSYTIVTDAKLPVDPVADKYIYAWNFGGVPTHVFLRQYARAMFMPEWEMEDPDELDAQIEEGLLPQRGLAGATALPRPEQAGDERKSGTTPKESKRTPDNGTRKPTSRKRARG